MADRSRLISKGEGTTVLQFPSSPDSSEEDERLVYQRSDRRRRKSVDSNGSSSAAGKKPLVDTRLSYKQYSAIDHMPQRERMDMDFNGKNSTTFSRQRGFFLDVRWAIALLVFFVASLLLVGLLVGFLAPRKCTNCNIPDENVPDSGGGGGSSVIPLEEAFALRLPLTVFPLAYSIKLQPFLNGNLTTNGTMSLIVNCIMETQNITLNVLNVNVTRESLMLENVNGNSSAPKITDLTYDVNHQFVIIHLESTLSVNESYQLNMSFVSLINDVLAGLYKSSYKSGNETKYLAVTQFEATDARRVFPCFDEPAFKATFDISIIREPNMTAVSNGPLIATEPWEDGWEIDHFGTTPKMSTYLVAFVISDFVNLSISTEEPMFTVWSRKDVIASAKYPASIGPGIIQYYNKFFNITYPMKKTDNVAIPDFNAGAMENWGLITYRETSLLFDEKLSTAYDKQYICQTVAHELAHQWFGNLVTPLWWNDLWLNEGFASYMEYIGSDVVEPAWKMMELFITDKFQSALSLDALKTSHPISVEVRSPNEINDLFDGISYDKGASIIRMMHYFLGNETFQLGLQNYLRDLAYSNAVSDDLWNHLYDAQNISNAKNIANVSKIMNTWSKQTGYPLLTVIRNYTDLTINLTQNIFLMNSNNMTDVEKESLWEVPIAWASQETPLGNWSTYPSLWLDNQSMITDQIPVRSSSWVLLNIEAAGFYRVNYDEQNWLMITRQLQNDYTNLPVITRAQILDDSFSLAQAGILKYTIPIELSRYLSNETEYVPYSAGMSNLGVISNMFIRSEVYGLITDYLLNLSLPTYHRLGWKDIRNLSVQQQYMQSDTLSTVCGRDYPDCVKIAVQYFNQWKSNPQTELNPNWRKLIYCTGIAHGTSADWDFVWNRYLVESVPSEKSKLRSSLSCTREMWMLSKLLQMSLTDPGISQQDSPTVISQVASTDHGRELAFNYVRQNWDTLYKMFGDVTFSLSDIISVIAGRLNTQSELDDFTTFKNKVFAENKAGTAKTSFNQALEVINSHIQFMNRSYDEISGWLKGRTPNQTTQIKINSTTQNTGANNTNSSNNSNNTNTESGGNVQGSRNSSNGNTITNGNMQGSNSSNNGNTNTGGNMQGSNSGSTNRGENVQGSSSSNNGNTNTGGNVQGSSSGNTNRQGSRSSSMSSQTGSRLIENGNRNTNTESGNMQGKSADSGGTSSGTNSRSNENNNENPSRGSSTSNQGDNREANRPTSSQLNSNLNKGAINGQDRGSMRTNLDNFNVNNNGNSDIRNPSTGSGTNNQGDRTSSSQTDSNLSKDAINGQDRGSTSTNLDNFNNNNNGNSDSRNPSTDLSRNNQGDTLESNSNFNDDAVSGQDRGSMTLDNFNRNNPESNPFEPRPDTTIDTHPSLSEGFGRGGERG